MRVKSVELHGFKSFAHPTRLEFDSGLAGIVGPNGSGKSNLVEAVRWVLGEQSYSQLRGKRTEDVIWSGGGKHAPSGMAEVSITLDNSDRSLSLPYAEVTITRRAYRSGENEYLINRSRVRLRDVIELTGAIGQGYSVVSQGMADAALSLSPEGRRGLFEEAADITQHYARRDETLRKLSQMQANTTRVEDLLSELEPRLRALARQARQARERAAEEKRLRTLQLAYYSSELRRSDESVHGVALKLSDIESRVAELQRSEQVRASEESRLREALSSVEIQLAELHRSRRQLAEAEANATRNLITADSRRTQLQHALDTTASRLGDVIAAREAAAVELKEAEQSLQEAVQQEADARRELAHLEAQTSEQARQQSLARREVERLQATAYEQDQAATRARNRVTALQDRLDAGETELMEQEGEARRQDSVLAGAQRRASETEQALDDARSTASVVAHRLEEVRNLLRAAEQDARKLEGQRSEKATQLREQESRLALLTEMDQSGSGLNRAAQTAVRASTAGKLHGIVGPLGSLIETPEELDDAIEAALGPALQNIVVEEWRQAEAAIELLRRSGMGRVTFLPLDTLRPPVRPSIGPRRGMVGIASDLVSAAANVQPAVRHALGRVLIVDDLQVARALLRESLGISALVTLRGEIVRPGGSLTGGSAGRERGVLARRRELRTLPGDSARLRSELNTLETELLQLKRKRGELENRERELIQQRRGADSSVRAAEAAARDAAQHLARVAQQREWALTIVTRSGKECEALRLRLKEASGEAQTAGQSAEAASREARAALVAIGDAAREAREVSERVATLRTSVAVGVEKSRAAKARREKAAEAVRQLAESSDRLGTQHEQIRNQLATASRDADIAREVRDELASRLERIASAIEPLEERQRALRGEQDALHHCASVIASNLHRAEEQRLAAALELQKLEDGRQALRDEARRELGPIPVPSDLEPPADVRDAIRRSVDRLARIGPINELAAHEHEDLEQRREFLLGQLDDVRVAEQDLHRVISTLEEQMEQRFTETFGLVSDCFNSYFQRLFGGGSGRLVLVTKGDTVGVEIQAQPPGKRLGNLSLLSGGERALTSSALLFALIRAGGAPFCVLDEVDAALDENNVGRFCDLLEEMSRDTQFIVITHNRGTIERTSRLYGVSMESSGISQVLSLKLDDVAEERASA